MRMKQTLEAPILFGLRRQNTSCLKQAEQFAITSRKSNHRQKIGFRQTAQEPGVPHRHGKNFEEFRSAKNEQQLTQSF